METSNEKFDSKINQPNEIINFIHILNDITRLMIRFFTVTDEDRIAAGIRIDCKKYESHTNVHP